MNDVSLTIDFCSQKADLSFIRSKWSFGQLFTLVQGWKWCKLVMIQIQFSYIWNQCEFCEDWYKYLPQFDLKKHKKIWTKFKNAFMWMWTSASPQILAQSIQHIGLNLTDNFFHFGQTIYNHCTVALTMYSNVSAIVFF